MFFELVTTSDHLRFSQWKEENAGASQVVVKKVAHCHVCRHPGEWCPAADPDERWPAEWWGPERI